MNNSRLVTKFISEIEFINPVRLGDVIELGVMVREFGRTSITLGCEVRNKATGQPILTIDKIVFVNLDAEGAAAPHGRQEVTETRMVYRQPPIDAAPPPPPVNAPLARPPIARPRVAPVGGGA